MKTGDLVKEYPDDRKAIEDLYRAQEELKKAGWDVEELFREEILLENGESLFLPVNCLRTPHKGPSLWILTGIHGEEPAGPMAILESISIILETADRGIPVVIFPLCNPAGYYKNWRYPDGDGYVNMGNSVGSSEHLLPDASGNPRSRKPSSPQAEALTGKVIELSREYPPSIVLDLHEDILSDRGYIYSQGSLGSEDPVAREIVRLFLEKNFPLHLSGETRFGEGIRNGVVAGARDGSIDELLASANTIHGPGPSARTVIVIETGAKGILLEERVKIQREILREIILSCPL